MNLLKNPIYIHDHAMVSPLESDGFATLKSSVSFENDIPVGRLNPADEKSLVDLRLEKSTYKNLDRSTLLALLAARRLKIEDKNSAVNIGSSRGSTGVWEDSYNCFRESGTTPSHTSPLTTLGNISSWVAQDLGINGTAFSHSITCATASHSILNAIAWLESGMAQSFIAGGAEAPLTNFTIAQMKALRIYSSEKDDFPSRALDLEKSNNQMVLGEAAACFLLSKTPTPTDIKITGFGTAVETLKSATSVSVDGSGFQKSMRQAMGKLSVDNIDAIVTHAPATLQGDRSEVAAIKAVFGNRHPVLCNNKWQLGHSLGASAAISTAMAVEMLSRGSLYKIPYLDKEVINPRGDQRIPSKILINSSGFGGNFVTLLLEKG